MPTVAYLTSSNMVPGREPIRDDLHELEQQLDEIVPALARRGWTLRLQVWDDPSFDPRSVDAIVVGTTWDYHSRAPEFLAAVDGMARWTPVFNDPELLRWNAEKSYLRDLAEAGIPIVPTRWAHDPTKADLRAAFEAFGADRLVIKSLVGAAAEGQTTARRGQDPAPLPTGGALIQPFLDAATTEGEYSYIFIDGSFSHALLKKAADGDYRVQSIYGGTETAHTPSAGDLAAATAVMKALPGDPLYARIDLMRGPEGDLLLMEAELIEPFLYPLQGPELGKRLAQALVGRVGG